MQRDQVHLLDVLQAARHAREFAQSLDRAGFDASIKEQSAILWQITLIGEAVRRLSQEFRAKHTEIPWQDIAGMRSKVIHEYDRIDLAQVWHVVQIEIPTLISQIEPLVPPDEPDDAN